MTSYERLAERLIETERTMIGKRAVDVARSVDGLTITDDGAVANVANDQRAVVDDLVRAYVDVMGESARRRLTDVASEYDDLELPATLGGPAVDTADEESATDDPADSDEGGTTAAADEADLVTNPWGEEYAADEGETAETGAFDVVERSLDSIYVTVTGERGRGPVPVGQVILDAVLAETDLDSEALDHLSAYVAADEVVAFAEADDRSSLTFAVEGHEVTLDERGAVTVE